MRIGVNLLYLIPGIGGTETYAISLLRALTRIDQKNEYVLFLNERGATLNIVDAPNVRRVVLPFDGSNRAVRYAMEQVVLPVRIRRERIDVLHSMGYVGPFHTNVPHIVTVHDLHHVAFPQSLSRSKKMALDFFVGGTARRADRVVAISEFSRSQILEHAGVPYSKIDVVMSAGSDHMAPPTDSAIRETATRLGVHGPWITAFSSRTPNKNIAGLVNAFATIADKVPQTLVLLGHLPPGKIVENAIRSAGLTNRVIVTGYVADDDVLPMVAGADLFVFPSFYEGFGIPVLDAQLLGVPVACSSAAALPEVAGDGALLFDPRNHGEMAEAMHRLLTDSTLSGDMVGRGKANAARFNWEKTAKQMADIYATLYSQQRGRLA